MKKISSIILILIIAGCNPKPDDTNEASSSTGVEATVDSLTLKEKLGKLLFFEKSLSTPAGQNCAM
jgi:cytochrome c peroxidase